MTTQRETPHPALRGGGTAAFGGDLFELSAGELCLDFANTLDSRPTDEPKELLTDYGDLVRWSVQAEALTPRLAKRLGNQAEREERQAAAALRRARTLREAIFEVFSASAGGRRPPAAALQVLNGYLPRVLVHLRLARDRSVYRWVWEGEGEGIHDALDRMLWPVVRSAADLLTSKRLDRVRVCSAEECDWLFLDLSRNRSRRWCDMTVCGNRSKVRRFRQAQRGS